ncbi:MAG: HypC/HybG/HupF family hydrogenase formation chaperone [bacterium]|nr:HypC/HybG/HupF family hydrogenase formation chaperone [bacterium]
MCLAIPGKVISLHEENGLLMGKVEFGGTLISACLAYVPEVKVGEYVIVHAGFALNVIDEEEAERTFALLKEIGESEGQG